MDLAAGSARSRRCYGTATPGSPERSTMSIIYTGVTETCTRSKPARAGAGSIPAWVSIFQTVEAASAIPNGQFAGDSSIPPSCILFRQEQHERSNRAPGGWSVRALGAGAGAGAGQRSGARVGRGGGGGFVSGQSRRPRYLPRAGPGGSPRVAVIAADSAASQNRWAGS
jgi:hypothetical protein